MSDKILIMKAFGAEKRAADMLGVGPSDSTSKSGEITKTTSPLHGKKALSSLIGYTRGKTTEASMNEQNAKKPEDEQEETKPGVERLESASDTPPKKAPAKKPEEKSENEVEYEEKEAKLAIGKHGGAAWKAVKKLLGDITGGVGRPIAKRVGKLKDVRVSSLEELFPELMGKKSPNPFMYPATPPRDIQSVGEALRMVGRLSADAPRSLAKMVGEKAAPIGRGAAGTAGAAKAIGAGTLGAGGLAAFGLGRASKGEKKEEKKSSFNKRAIIGTTIGGIHGLLRTPDKGEDRLESMLTGGARGAGADTGALAGLGLGGGLGLGIGAATKSPKLGLITALLGLLSGGYLGYKRQKIRTRRPGEMGDEPEKGEKKSSFNKAAIGGIPVGPGTLVGALHGLVREKDPDEDRAQAVGRSALTGVGTDVGMGLGGIGGALAGGKLGKTLFPKSSPFDQASQNRQALVTLLGMLLGTAGGGYAGYRLSRRSPKKEASALLPFDKAGADFGESKGLSTTAKVLIGALAGAGVPVAMWHGAGPAVRKLIQKIYQMAPLEKLYKLPQTHPRLAKGLMYAPAGIGAAVGGLSGDDDDEYKLAHVKYAQPDMRQMAADQAPSKDIIPYLGPLGGKVLSGLGGITSGIGLPGVGSKLEEWSQNPTARSIAGGGTTAIAALLAALAARKLMKGREDEVEG